jgi:hypothetical protein
MNMAGRVAWVRFVLLAISIYVMIAMKVPKWFIKAINFDEVLFGKEKKVQREVLV